MLFGCGDMICTTKVYVRPLDSFEIRSSRCFGLLFFCEPLLLWVLTLCKSCELCRRTPFPDRIGVSWDGSALERIELIGKATIFGDGLVHQCSAPIPSYILGEPTIFGLVPEVVSFTIPLRGCNKTCKTKPPLWSQRYNPTIPNHKIFKLVFEQQKLMSQEPWNSSKTSNHVFFFVENFHHLLIQHALQQQLWPGGVGNLNLQDRLGGSKEQPRDMCTVQVKSS